MSVTYSKHCDSTFILQQKVLFQKYQRNVSKTDGCLKCLIQMMHRRTCKLLNICDICCVCLCVPTGMCVCVCVCVHQHNVFTQCFIVSNSIIDWRFFLFMWLQRLMLSVNHWRQTNRME